MIIGICGPAGSGKSTVADILVRNHSFTAVSLADPIKRACRDFFDFTEEQLWGPSSARNCPDMRYPQHTPGLDPEPVYLTPRHALQQLGTEFGRACYENVWVDMCLRIANTLMREEGWHYTPQAGLIPSRGFSDAPPRPGIVIPDVRFGNEEEAVHAAGGIVWRTSYDGGPGLQGAAATHASEAHFDALRVDAHIPGDTGLDALPEIVAQMLKEARRV